MAESHFPLCKMGLSAFEWDLQVCPFDDPRPRREIRVTPADVSGTRSPILMAPSPTPHNGSVLMYVGDSCPNLVGPN